MKPDAHVRIAHPDSNNGATLLRRGHSFTDGTDGLGRLDAGMFFLAYQHGVRKGFLPVRRSLAIDPLNEYIQHVGSVGREAWRRPCSSGRPCAPRATAPKPPWSASCWAS